MNRRTFLLSAAAMPMTTQAALAQAALAQVPDNDPYIWMEEIEGERPLAWARKENERSLAVLQNDPAYGDLHAKALAIATAKDRIPTPGFLADRIDNFWQDADHVRGVWRRTALDSYRTAAPDWETILDIDALAKAEGANWVFKGGQELRPDQRLSLVSLSNGGKDAVVVREFDIAAKAFVPGGFDLPEGKHRFDWVDKDTIVLATEWTPGELTTSGYPFVVKMVKRGQPLSAAAEVYRGESSDGGYGVWPLVLREADGAVAAVLVNRPLDTFASETYLVTPKGPVRLPLPLKSTVHDYLAGRLIFTLEQDWPEQNLKSGDLAQYVLADLTADPAKAKPALILRPGPRESVDGVTSTKTKLVVSTLENVKGRVHVYTPAANGWTHSKLNLPDNSTIAVGSASDRDDRFFLTVTSYLTPSTLWLADGATGKVEQIKALPAKFDASNHVVEQHEATSKDGTKVPYFLVRRKDMAFDGSTPTLQYAYGGFQVSLTPGYNAAMGKLWLERGGAYVVANIRGGGEFGPKWHEAALKQNRQRAYDDFFAVSEDLIRRKVTSPQRLGIMGGSNGGLLMGVALTQRPELYSAVVVQVPLFDMIRFNKIGAGSSWMGEYGDPSIPAERAWIEKYSPYQALKAGQKYPEVFIETSTKDDRVHPAHARKAAARLMELGYPVLYYENTDGGHAAAANLNETAKRQALEYTYLTRRLMR